MRVDSTAELKKPYDNAGVVGLVNISNQSYLISLLQVLMGQKYLRHYYIDQGNFWSKLNPSY